MAHLKALGLASPSIRLDRKKLAATNTLAYCLKALITAKLVYNNGLQSRMQLNVAAWATKSGANVIKLFTTVSYKFPL